MDVGPASERSKQGPLRPGQVLEAVGEHRPAVPRLELGLHACDGVRAIAVAIGELQPLQLAEIGREKHREIALDLARVDEARLELRDGAEQRIPEAGEPGGGAEPVQARAGERAPEDEAALRVGRHPEPPVAAAGDRTEEIVERADVAAQKSGATGQEIALDAIHFRPVRDDEERLAVEVLQVAIEEPRDLPRVRRANQQRERHPCSLDVRPGGSGARRGA